MFRSSRFGVMQGRLLAKYRGRYQAHPLGYWQREFDVAAGMELDLIEFILDFEDGEKNPLMNESGIAEIRAVATRSGVSVETICADYFMECPLHGDDPDRVEQCRATLRRLIPHASELGVSDIVIPCVDQSSLRGEASQARLLRELEWATALAADAKINLALETDLAPEPFRKLLDTVGSPRVTVNYDIGNSASLGFDPAEEFDAYGERISDIHVKDREAGGGPVRLGTGAANFDTVFALIAAMDYRGPIIMQAYRDDEGVAIFREQEAWLRRRYDAEDGGSDGNRS